MLCTDNGLVHTTQMICISFFVRLGIVGNFGEAHTHTFHCRQVEHEYDITR